MLTEAELEGLEEFADEVADGGVYWVCRQCGRGGVIKASEEVAARLREYVNVPAPHPFGVEFTTCDEHGGVQHEPKNNV